MADLPHYDDIDAGPRRPGAPNRGVDTLCKPEVFQFSGRVRAVLTGKTCYGHPSIVVEHVTGHDALGSACWSRVDVPPPTNALVGELVMAMRRSRVQPSDPDELKRAKDRVDALAGDAHALRHELGCLVWADPDTLCRAPIDHLELIRHTFTRWDAASRQAGHKLVPAPFIVPVGTGVPLQLGRHEGTAVPDPPLPFGTVICESDPAGES